MIAVNVTGLKELQDVLESKPRKVAKRLLRNVLRKAAAVWQAEMQLRAPKLQTVKFSTNPKQVRIPGDLSRHIGMKVNLRGDDTEGSISVGPTKRTFWSLFLEFGTRYMTAKPFIRQSFESKKDEVLRVFVVEGQKVVEEEMKHV